MREGLWDGFSDGTCQYILWKMVCPTAEGSLSLERGMFRKFCSSLWILASVLAQQKNSTQNTISFDIRMHKVRGFEGERRNQESWEALDFVSVGSKSQGYPGDGDSQLKLTSKGLQ